MIKFLSLACWLAAALFFGVGFWSAAKQEVKLKPEPSTQAARPIADDNSFAWSWK